MKRTILLLSLLLFCGSLRSQWVNISIPDGNLDAAFLYKTNSGKVFAGTNVGLYVSTNFGDSWAFTSNGIEQMTQIICLAEKDSVLFAGSYFYGLYKSTNSGKSWFSIPINTNINIIYSLLVKDNLIFAGTNGGVYKSSNNGLNWVYCFSNIFTHGVEAMVTNQNCIFATTHYGSQGMVYRSSNDGAIWDTVNSGLGTFGIFELQTCNNNIYGLGLSEFYISTNNGNNWIAYGTCNQYNFLSKSENYITSGSYGVCKYITSCGTIFTNITNGLADLSIQDFITSGSSFLLATNKGFYKSTNTGVNWFKSNSGTFDNSYKGVGSYATIVLAVNLGGGYIFRKDVYGGNWVATTGDIGENKPHKFIYDGNYFYIFCDNIIKRTALTSPDNWVNISIPSLTPKQFDVSDNFIVSANANKIVYKSTNGGTNWTTVTTSGLPTINYAIQSLTITPDNSILLGLKPKGGTYEMYKLNYGGTIWNKITVSNIAGFSPLVFKNISGDIFSAFASNVCTSTNNGLNWTLKNQGIPNDTVSGFAEADNKIFCSTKNSGVYKYSEQNINWTAYNTDLGNQKVNAIAGYFAILYAATDSGMYYADVYTGIENQSTTPTQYYLSQNKPNPFNPVTQIEYSVYKQGQVRIKVYDLLGKEVITLVNENKASGKYKINFNGANLSSGIYFYRMEVNDFTDIRKMILIK